MGAKKQQFGLAGLVFCPGWLAWLAWLAGLAGLAGWPGFHGLGSLALADRLSPQNLAHAKTHCYGTPNYKHICGACGFFSETRPIELRLLPAGLNFRDTANGDNDDNSSHNI